MDRANSKGGIPKTARTLMLSEEKSFDTSISNGTTPSGSNILRSNRGGRSCSRGRSVMAKAIRDEAPNSSLVTTETTHTVEKSDKKLYEEGLSSSVTVFSGVGGNYIGPSRCSRGGRRIDRSSCTSLAPASARAEKCLWSGQESTASTTISGDTNTALQNGSDSHVITNHNNPVKRIAGGGELKPVSHIRDHTSTSTNREDPSRGVSYSIDINDCYICPARRGRGGRGIGRVSCTSPAPNNVEEMNFSSSHVSFSKVISNEPTTPLQTVSESIEIALHNSPVEQITCKDDEKAIANICAHDQLQKESSESVEKPAERNNISSAKSNCDAKSMNAPETFESKNDSSSTLDFAPAVISSATGRNGGEKKTTANSPTSRRTPSTNSINQGIALKSACGSCQMGRSKTIAEIPQTRRWLLSKQKSFESNSSNSNIKSVPSNRGGPTCAKGDSIMTKPVCAESSQETDASVITSSTLIGNDTTTGLQAGSDTDEFTSCSRPERCASADDGKVFAKIRDFDPRVSKIPSPVPVSLKNTSLSQHKTIGLVKMNEVSTIASTPKKKMGPVMPPRAKTFLSIRESCTLHPANQTLRPKTARIPVPPRTNAKTAVNKATNPTCIPTSSKTRTTTQTSSSTARIKSLLPNTHDRTVETTKIKGFLNLRQKLEALQKEFIEKYEDLKLTQPDNLERSYKLIELVKDAECNLFVKDSDAVADTSDHELMEAKLTADRLKREIEELKNIHATEMTTRENECKLELEKEILQNGMELMEAKRTVDRLERENEELKKIHASEMTTLKNECKLEFEKELLKNNGIIAVLKEKIEFLELANERLTAAVQISENEIAQERAKGARLAEEIEAHIKNIGIMSDKLKSEESANKTVLWYMKKKEEELQNIQKELDNVKKIGIEHSRANLEVTRQLQDKLKEVTQLKNTIQTMEKERIALGNDLDAALQELEESRKAEIHVEILNARIQTLEEVIDQMEKKLAERLSDSRELSDEVARLNECDAKQKCEIEQLKKEILHLVDFNNELGEQVTHAFQTLAARDHITNPLPKGGPQTQLIEESLTECLEEPDSINSKSQALGDFYSTLSPKQLELENVVGPLEESNTRGAVTLENVKHLEAEDAMLKEVAKLTGTPSPKASNCGEFNPSDYFEDGRRQKRNIEIKVKKINT